MSWVSTYDQQTTGRKGNSADEVKKNELRQSFHWGDLHWTKRQKEMREPGLEPGSRAWEARMLTATLSAPMM
jgi:hypothetical protein